MNLQEWETGKQTSKTHEVLIAAPAGDEWHFKGALTSSLFTYTMTGDWNERMYAPYYKEFWSPLHQELERWEGPVEITVDAQYTFGVLEEEELRQLMEEWRITRVGKRPNFLTVTRQDEGDNVAFSRLEIWDLSVAVATV
jgi:hypothetical protein